MYYIGIDLGGMSVKAGLVDEEGRIVRKATCPTLVERGARPIVDDMARLCLDLIRDEGITEDEVKAIGVGLPGIEDPVTGHVPFCTNLYWHEVPVREWPIPHFVLRTQVTLHVVWSTSARMLSFVNATAERMRVSGHQSSMKRASS